MARLIPSTLPARPAAVSPTRVSTKADQTKTRSVASTTRIRVSEEEYWDKYYDNIAQDDHQYEWNNGYVEEKPMTDYVSYLMYDWLVTLLKEYLQAQPIAKLIGLEMGFRLALPQKRTIRKPDLGVVLNSNPVPLGPHDQSYRGIFDLCIESVSYSKPSEVKRDTVAKKREYAQAGVTEYYLLDARGKRTAFYQLTANGIYTPIQPTADGLITSQILPGWQFRLTDLQRQPSLLELSDDPVYRSFVWPALQAAKLAQQAAELQAQTEKEARQVAEALAQKEKEARHQEAEARQLAETKLQQLELELARWRQAR